MGQITRISASQSESQSDVFYHNKIYGTLLANLTITENLSDGGVDIVNGYQAQYIATLMNLLDY